MKQLKNFIVYVDKDEHAYKRLVHSILHEYRDQRCTYVYDVPPDTNIRIDRVESAKFGMFRSDNVITTVARQYILYIEENDLRKLSKNCRDYVHQYLPTDVSPSYVIFNYEIKDYSEYINSINIVSEIYQNIRTFYSYDYLTKPALIQEDYKRNVEFWLKNGNRNVMDLTDVTKFVDKICSDSRLYNRTNDTRFRDVIEYLNHIYIPENPMIIEKHDYTIVTVRIAAYLLKVRGVPADFNRYINAYEESVSLMMSPYNMMTLSEYIVFYQHLPQVLYASGEIVSSLVFLQSKYVMNFVLYTVEYDEILHKLIGNKCYRLELGLQDIHVIDYRELFEEADMSASLLELFEQFETIMEEKCIITLDKVCFIQLKDRILFTYMKDRPTLQIEALIEPLNKNLHTVKRNLNLDTFQSLMTLRMRYDYSELLQNFMSERIKSMNKKYAVVPKFDLNIEYYDTTKCGLKSLYYCLSSWYSRRFANTGLNLIEESMFDPICVKSRGPNGLLEIYSKKIGIKNLRYLQNELGIRSINPCGLHDDMPIYTRDLKGVL